MKHKKRKPSNVALITILTVIITLFVLNYTVFNRNNKAISMDYTTYTVTAGDTLWDIASRERPKKDPREVVYEIKEMNGISPIIQEGQVLKIPIWR